MSERGAGGDQRFQPRPLAACPVQVAGVGVPVMNKNGQTVGDAARLTALPHRGVVDGAADSRGDRLPDQVEQVGGGAGV